MHIFLLAFQRPEGNLGLAAWPPDGELCSCPHLEHVVEHYVHLVTDPGLSLMAAETKLCIVRLNDVTQLKASEGMNSVSIQLSDKQYVAYYPLPKDVDHDLILTYEEAKQLGMETLQEHIAKTLSN